jgi:heterodisulfide reductase subunit B
VDAEALALSCPLCEFNLSGKQETFVKEKALRKAVPTYYFTQLLALALGLDPKSCYFDLNQTACIELLRRKKCIKER